MGSWAGTLQIGNATTGAIVVSGTIDSSLVLGLELINNGAITETGSITAAALAIHSTGPATLTGSNNIHTLAASVTGSLTFNNAGALTIGLGRQSYERQHGRQPGSYGGGIAGGRERGGRNDKHLGACGP